MSLMDEFYRKSTIMKKRQETISFSEIGFAVSEVMQSIYVRTPADLNTSVRCLLGVEALSVEKLAGNIKELRRNTSTH